MELRNNSSIPDSRTIITSIPFVVVMDTTSRYFRYLPLNVGGDVTQCTSVRLHTHTRVCALRYTKYYPLGYI